MSTVMPAAAPSAATPAAAVPSALSRWRTPLLLQGLALLAVLLLYRSSFIGMWTIWSRSDTFAHAFLVPPITLWLVWRLRAQVAVQAPRWQPWVLLPMLLCGLAWLLGDMAGVNAVTQLAATALLVLTVPAVLGLGVARTLAFPLGFLFFMVPLGEFLMPQLMAWTADFTVAAVAMSGVPVYREGLQFVIPTGTWSVVEACSGVRYLIASVMVGTLFAYLNYRSLRRRLVFCAVAFLVPVVANWLRAYMIVMLGHVSGNTLAVGVDHLIYGWLFFGVVVLLMFFIGARWSQDIDLGPTAQQLAASLAARAPVAAWWTQPMLVLSLLVVLAVPQAVLWRMAAQGAQAGPDLASTFKLPALNGTTAAAGAPALVEPVFVGAAALTQASYALQGAQNSAQNSAQDGAAVVTVHVAYYRQQGYGRKLVSSENTLLQSENHDWNRVASNTAQQVIDGQPVNFRQSELLGNGRNKGQRVEARQVYWVDGQFTASDHEALLLGIRSRLAGRGDDGAMLTLTTQGQPPLATDRLDRFTAEHLPALQAWLAATRAAR